LRQLSLRQAPRESRQDGKGNIAQAFRQRHRPAPRAGAGQLREVRVRNLIDKRDEQGLGGVDRDEKGGRIPVKRENRAGCHGRLEVQRRGRGREGEFGEEDDGQCLRAGDNEHLREVVREDARKRRVEGSGEGGGAEAGAQVGVVARFDGEDGAGGGDKGRVVGKGSGAADVGADADSVMSSVLVEVVILWSESVGLSYVVIMLARETKDLGSVSGNL